MVSIRKGIIYTTLAVLVIVLTSLTLVYATGYTPAEPSHKFLYADFIRGMAGASVIVNDRFNITSSPTFTASYSNSLDLFSTDTSPTTIPLLVTSSSLFAAGLYGAVVVTGPHVTALTINVNRTGIFKPSALTGKIYSGAMFGSPAEREIMLVNASYAAWGATDDAYYGFIAGTDPFAVGKAGAAGLVTPTRGGTLGTSNYGVYGQYDANVKGYLGSINYGAYGQYDTLRYGYLGGSLYGAYGQYDASNYGRLGSVNTGVYGLGSTYGVRGDATGVGDYGVYGYHNAAAGIGYGVTGQTLSSSGTGVYGYANNGAGGTAIYGFTTAAAAGYSGFFYGGQGVSIVSGGLCVDNDLACDPDVNGKGEINALVYNTGATDLAEKYSSLESLEAGDVVVIENRDHVKKSNKAFDKLAAGIVSEEPGIVLGVYDQGYPIALSGRVPVKASAENGAIEVGDLLTTSSTPGYAMKCRKSDDCFGAVLGKALEPLSSGKGKVLALVMLN